MSLDSVNKKLEAMVPELEDLYLHNIFTREEIDKIIKSRREFEYALTSATRAVIDFIRYSRYEMNLELLKRKRIQRLGLKDLSFTLRGTWARRIEKILQRALKKFPLDIQLWYQYFEFSIIANRISLGKWFSKAILLHPYKSQFWIWAANWEYLYNQQISTARKLFHRALRLMPKEKILYLEYCRLELLYATQVRKELRGQPQYESTDISGLTETGFSTMDSFISIIDSSVSQEYSNDPILQLQIPKIVYSHAIQYYPDDIYFHKQFLWLLGEFPNTNSLQEFVCEQIQTSTQPEARIFSIYFPYRNGKLPQEFYEKIDAILLEDYSPELLLEIIHFCSYLFEKDKNHNPLMAFILRLWERLDLSTDWIITEKLLYAFAHLLIRVDPIKNTGEKALKKATELFPENPDTWYQYVLLLKTVHPKDKILDAAFQEALSMDKINLSLLLLYFEVCLSNQNETTTDIILEKYKSVLGSQHYSKEELQQFSESVLDLILMKAESELIRKLYSYTFTYFPATCSFHLKCANWEANSQENVDLNIIRNIFRNAINRYGKTESEVWLKWIEFETNSHQLSTAGTIFWEAKKTLEPSHLQSFLISHSSWVNLNNTTLNENEMVIDQ